MSLPRGWIDHINAMHLGPQLGTACPSCREAHRGANDRRAAVKWTGTSWFCHRCRAGGGPFRWLAFSLLGRAPVRADFDAIGAEAVARGWLTGQVEAYAPPPPKEPPKPPAYPPRSEVEALWGSCGPIAGPVAAWVDSRGADAELVRAWDLARSLPRGRVPKWAEAWRGGWWCVLPAYDGDGVLRTLRARWVLPGDAPRAKTRPPTGFELAGTALAGPGALQARGDVLVVEGEPAFLVAATRSGMPTFGVYAGCGGPAIWRGVRGVVHIATDADDQGDHYAERIAGWARDARRERPPEGLGWDDAFLAGAL